ncbi:hypothetical protein ACFWIN_31960 [Streptomyces sp. NPDC127049]|uniref:hypothetical protein n=1 Tax=unclassified Streptomyces TaxID=2593676 RepID=UPI0035E0481D
MVTSRLVNSAGTAFSALLLATVTAVAGAIPAGAFSGKGGQVVADHGWGRKAADVPASPGGLVVLAGGTGDHGWG